MRKRVMRNRAMRLAAILSALAFVAAACGGGSSSSEETSGGGTSDEPVTITVWDYYGESTPITPLVEAFEAEYPNITVNVESLDWDSMLEKLTVVLTSGDSPDVVTADMTWLPTFAPLGAFANLNDFSGGELNGKPLADAYNPGALEAMTSGDQTVAMLYDFDVYGLYYRSDLFEAAELEVPTTWDELEAAATTLGADGHYYAVQPDAFHAAQWIYENGGSLLNDDNTASAVSSPEAIEALEHYLGLTSLGAGYHWSAEEGWELTPGLKDGRIAMFADGAYYMGIMKDAAPEMAGQWKVAPHPTNGQPGSYLGGTGLVIPSRSEHQEAAWTFIEFAMRLENQIAVFETAGAAPALTEALSDPAVDVADPYFNDQHTLTIFQEAMNTARPFPYVQQWNDIDETLTLAIEEVLIGDKDVTQAFGDATETIDGLLK